MKNKYIAFLLSLFLWGIWFHRFYLGFYFVCFLYLIFSFTLIPFIISILEAIYFLILPQKEFDIKYNYDYLIKQKQLQDLQLK